MNAAIMTASMTAWFWVPASMTGIGALRERMPQWWRSARDRNRADATLARAYLDAGYPHRTGGR